MDKRQIKKKRKKHSRQLYIKARHGLVMMIVT